ncbi:hypothetical protein GH714_007377 [Hevea brasiliensis]|uniref:Fe2OG dioxygenase domain-containing protein n=1 Tax=Hevea brasiliensis TaxID=3981 RepID=A0A6A6LF43_HEVBR|nr:hypothetical protein GH714_007377 [Hevea brasiliensis]
MHAETGGFFQVINHGVPLEKREKIFNASRKFFAQPKEEKIKIRRDEKRVLGYYDTEHTKNVRDWKEVFDFAVQNPTIVPASYEPEIRKEVCEEYAKEMEKLGFKLLELIALSLGLKADRFHGFFEDQTTFIRLNHYPPCPVPQLALGVGRHKDAVALTILAQDDVGGLEVKSNLMGSGLGSPQPQILTLLMLVWSNDAYESVEHRVKVNPEKERFSVPYFEPAHYLGEAFGGNSK